MAEATEISYFDLRMVHDHFDRALLQEDDVDIKAYIDAYKELYKWVRRFTNLTSFFSTFFTDTTTMMIESALLTRPPLFRFFQLMGSVFGFVSSDLKQKIEILRSLIEKDSENYVSVKKMIEYEKRNKLLQKSDFANGTMTLLRLHRGLGMAVQLFYFFGWLELHSFGIQRGLYDSAFDISQILSWNF